MKISRRLRAISKAERLNRYSMVFGALIQKMSKKVGKERSIVLSLVVQKANVWYKLQLKLSNLMILWSALPDLNRSPVPDEAFVLLRELSRQCLGEIQRGRTATTSQLLSMLAEVRG